jgi:hypothetical protein
LLWNPEQLFDEGGIERQTGSQAMFTRSLLEVFRREHMLVAICGRR